MSRTRKAAWPVEARWEAHDGHRALTVVALAGVVAAVLLAVVGLPPWDVHGLLHRVGIMDPLCGATRSVRHTFRGELGLAWRYNPLGPVLAAGAVALLVRGIAGVATRRWLNVRIRWTMPLVAALLLLTAAVGIRQQAHADLLMSVG